MSLFETCEHTLEFPYQKPPVQRGAIVMDGAAARPFVDAGAAGGPRGEREYGTGDQSVNDKAQSDAKGG